MAADKKYYSNDIFKIMSSIDLLTLGKTSHREFFFNTTNKNSITIVIRVRKVSKELKLNGEPHATEFKESEGKKILLQEVKLNVLGYEFSRSSRITRL